MNQRYYDTTCGTTIPLVLIILQYESI
jgi:hypothetical protein